MDECRDITIEEIKRTVLEDLDMTKEAVTKGNHVDFCTNIRRTTHRLLEIKIELAIKMPRED